MYDYYLYIVLANLRLEIVSGRALHGDARSYTYGIINSKNGDIDKQSINHLTRIRCLP